MLEGNTLKVTMDLDLDADAMFSEACDALLSTSDEVVYLDLTEVGFIGSAFFGQMFTLNYRIKKQERKLILRVPAKLMSIMELLGLPQLIDVEVIE
jgi:anti-anti-sigma regulatory factor